MIKVRSDIKRMKGLLPKVRKKLMYAESEALNQTANIAAKAQRAQAPKVFDRPTPFFLNGIFNPKGKLGFVGRFSRWNTLRAEIIPGARGGQFKEAGRRINKTMLLQAEGGSRTPLKRKIPKPTEHARLNRYGNMPRGYVQRLLSSPDHVQLGENQGVKPGIYQRNRDGTLTIKIAYEDMIKHKPLFPFHRIARGVFDNNFKRELDRAIEKEFKARK